ncbi:hypothetical protein [uncultured Draconibacterium sp.]|uniref:hypothetical protein n=1 Tax=uncultured Draconibacterium sp. TaxID=1573823 RepID=UPI0029C6E1A3|nr:hypothetical protein [uncultured Draconibacterium sp.]
MIFLLLVVAGNAQRTYSVKNLQQISGEDLNLYYQKAMNLERTGETLALAGAAAGLIGILGGATLNDDCSSGGRGIMRITAATLMAGGVAVAIIGFTMYITGISRIERIRKVQFSNSLQMEVIPGGFYCSHPQSSPTGITLRISF